MKYLAYNDCLFLATMHALLLVQRSVASNWEGSSYYLHVHT